MKIYLYPLVTLILIIKTSLVYSSSLEDLSSEQLSDFYNDFIERSCSDEDCLNLKKRKFEACSDKACMGSFVEFEELSAWKCSKSKNFSGCIGQITFRSAMCSDLDCIRDISEEIKKEISPTELKKGRIKNIRKYSKIINTNGVKKTYPKSTSSGVSVARVSAPKSITTSASSSVTSLDKVDTQKEMMNLSQKANEDKCQSKECLMEMERVYAKLSPADKVSIENIVQDERFGHIPSKIVRIYLTDGPFSPAMIQHFKSNSSELSLSKYNYRKEYFNCSRYREVDCSYAKENDQWISAIRNYFNDRDAGFALAESIYKLKYTTPHQILCNIGFNKLPKGRTPFKEQVTGVHKDSYYFESFNPYPFSAATKLECLERMTKFEQAYKARLVELGNYPARKSFGFEELGRGGQLPPPILEYIRGECHSIIYTPSSDRINPNLKDLQSSNKRVFKSKSYKSKTRNECRFMANRDMYELDPSRWQEYIFYLGNVPFTRMSSKALPHRLTISKFAKYPQPYDISAPKCEISYERSGHKRSVREFDLPSGARDCLDVCKEQRAKLGKKKLSNFKCRELPNMLANPMFGFKSLIYSEEEKTYLNCSYFNYHWSRKPIREFIVESEEDCLSIGMNGKKGGAKAYADHYGFRLKKDELYDIEVRVNNKTLLRFSSNPQCTMGNLSRIGGRTSKYIGTKKVNVKNERECLDQCMKFKNDVSLSTTKSPNFVSCELGRSAYNPIMLNFKSAKTIDPFIAVSESDRGREEHYFNESFKEVWHGYPYISDLASSDE
ncbi:hypothetical protein BIY24_12565 [Halobacteriovorax marinus]|uniref:hypothetical protein n=1 Tax=Halobacteriovorax marinus TaxID=97084 RepID=UPI000BC2DAD3|nr:hypothetical protein [Halobacteriovorax marinus]ATH08748.1 hypothetical protein BIY24_12565 [Halobacteriovorax marinus]